MHVRVDSFLVSLASPTFSLAFFFSLSRGARYTLLHVYERWCAYACAVCTNAHASPHFTCHAGLSRRSNLPGRTKNFLAETWDDPARLGKRPRGERRSHVENLRRGRIQPPLCLLRRSKNHEMETRSQTWRPTAIKTDDYYTLQACIKQVEEGDAPKEQLHVDRYRRRRLQRSRVVSRVE